MYFGYICTLPKIIIIHTRTKKHLQEGFFGRYNKVSVVTAEEMQ